MGAPKLPSVENFARATLLQKREARGLAPSELAERLGVTQLQVGKWEFGTEPMPAEVFDRWLTAVGVTDATIRGLLKAAHAQALEAG